MLHVSNLNAWYGASHVLQDISLEVAKGEIVCLIGRNGAGKTTTLKSIMGLMDKTRGSVMFKGKEMLSQPAHVRFALGLAYVPEERRIVQGLSVRENLRLGLVASPEKKREVELIEEHRQDFPAARRAAGSGGGHDVRRRAADAGDRAGDDRKARSHHAR